MSNEDQKTQQVAASSVAVQAAAVDPAPAAEYGLQETKEMLDLIFAVGKAVVQAESDGAITIADLPLVLALIPKLGPAVGNADKIPAELSHLDIAEAEELVAYIAASGAVDNAKAQAIIDASLKLAVDLFALIKAIKA